MKRSQGIVFAYLNTIISIIVSLVLTPFLLKTLGDTEYGLYQTTASSVNYLVLFEFGIGTVMTRNIAISRNDPESDNLESIVSTIFTIAVFFSLFIILLSIVFYHRIPFVYAKTMTSAQALYAKKIFILLTGYLLVSFFTQSLDGFLLGMEQYSFAKLRAIVISVAKLILTLSVLSFRRPAVLIAWIDLGLSICANVVTVVYCVRNNGSLIHRYRFDRQILRASLPLCLALFLQSFINQANSNVDKFVIGAMLSLEDVALYTITQFFFTLFASIMAVPVSMYMPEIVRIMADKPDNKKLTESLVPACRLEAIIGGVILGGIFAVGKPFVSLFFGTSKAEAWRYALVILVPMYVNMTNAVVLNVLDVLNKRLARSFILMFGAVINVILTILLIGRYKIMGAVFATAVSLIVGNILLMNVYYWKKIGIRILFLFKEAYEGILLPCAFSAAVSYCVSGLIRQPLFAFLCGGILFVVLSATLLYCFGLRPKEKEQLLHLYTKLKSRKNQLS